MKKILYSFSLLIIISLITPSCSEDFLDNIPTSAISDLGVTASTGTAMAALNGIHRSMYIRHAQCQYQCGLGAWYCHIDEQGEDFVANAVSWPTHIRWLHVNDNNFYNWTAWYMFYGWIANANVLINGIDDNTKGPQSEKDLIVGQALAYRAYCHYQLVQQWADRYIPNMPNNQLGIPYMLKPTQEGQPRMTVDEVYEHINADLDQAILLLEGKSRKNKSHISMNVVKGIKARVALTTGNYPVAVTYAREARGGFALMDFDTYEKGFRMNSESSPEFMWASHIESDQSDAFGNYGAYISRNFSSTAIRTNPFSIFSPLYEKISPTDVRKRLWDPTGQHVGLELVSTASKFPYTSQKFIAVSTGDSRVDVPHMRISEMYLIEAEALARQGKYSEAAEALYPLAVIRDPEYTLSTNTGQTLIEEILIQRRIELWGEGQRFFDLKRLALELDRRGGNHNSAVTGNLMQVPASSFLWTSMIPLDEMNANPQMVQNPRD